jgi:spore coat polysaccharide biosynthesis protein SpsF
MRTVAIVQARMGSSRLPGKVMKLLANRSVLAHTLERVKAIPNIDTVIVATTTLAQDEVIVREAKRCGCEVFCGSEDDVLSRYYGAAIAGKADIVVRVTSDCPVFDPVVAKKVVEIFHAEKADYASNTLERSFPRGLDVEVFTMAALSAAFHEAVLPEQREHVTPFLYGKSERFQLVVYRAEQDYSRYRWTLDTEEDWALIQEIYSRLYHKDELFDWSQVLKLMQECPELTELNAHIEQKKLGE